jgi:hypothetical protein
MGKGSCNVSPRKSLVIFIFDENLPLERIEIHIFPFPAACRESGLQAGMIEEFTAVPSPFHRNLGKEQPAPPMPLYDQAMLPDIDHRRAGFRVRSD